MTITQRPLTYDDLRQMPDDGHRYELIDGEIYMSAAPNRAHQALARRLFLLLAAYLGPLGLDQELYFAPIEVDLPDGSTVQPDIVWIRPDRREALTNPGSIGGAPDLIVEILSPSTRIRDLRLKRRTYEEVGVPELWLVDPEERSITLLALRDGAYEPVEPVGHIVASPTLPGLTVNVAALFAGLPNSQGA